MLEREKERHGGLRHMPSLQRLREPCFARGQACRTCTEGRCHACVEAKVLLVPVHNVPLLSSRVSMGQGHARDAE